MVCPIRIERTTFSFGGGSATTHVSIENISKISEESTEISPQNTPNPSEIFPMIPNGSETPCYANATQAPAPESEEKSKKNKDEGDPK